MNVTFVSMTTNGGSYENKITFISQNIREIPI